MIRFFALVIGIFSFAVGAQENKPSESQQMNSNQCFQEFANNTALWPIRARMNTQTPEEKIKLRTSTAKASQREKTAIAAWLSESEKCQNLTMAEISGYSEEYKGIVRELHSRNNKAKTNLYAGTITWGQFVETGNADFDNFQTKMSALEERQRLAFQRWEAEQKRQAELKKAYEEAQAQVRHDAARAEMARNAEMQRQRELDAKAQANQQFMEGLMLLEASRRRPAPPPPMAPSFNCVTTPGAGNTTFTNCR